MRFFEVDRDGFVRGEARMSRLDAMRNLRTQDRHRGMFPDGLVLVPAPADVFPHVHRLDWATKTWVRRADPPPPTHQELRRGNYPDAREQVGVLMKMVAEMADGGAPSSATRAEFDALTAQIADVKKAHPKP